MGHLLSDKSSLIPLIDRLNRYPIGLVDSAKLREILSLLFSEEEAIVASRFPLHEATSDEAVRADRHRCRSTAPHTGIDGQQRAGHGPPLQGSL